MTAEMEANWGMSLSRYSEPGMQLRAKVKVDASQELSDRVREFLHPDSSVAQSLAEHGLKLAAVASPVVYRKAFSDALVPDDARMESEFRTVTAASDTQMRLRQHVALRDGKLPGDRYALTFNFLIDLGELAASRIRHSVHGIDPDLLDSTGRSMPVYATIPAVEYDGDGNERPVIDEDKLITAADKLRDFVLGDQVRGAKANKRERSANRLAHATNFRLVIPRPVAGPRRAPEN